ncbi:MAG: cupin domain-containing protein [Chloroflexota bacterium]
MTSSIQQGIVITVESMQAVNSLPWKEHATCEGVFLKHLVTGVATGGRFSCHLVKVRAGCEISEHVHPGHWELHEVAEGSGQGFLAGNVLDYRPGNAIVIPMGEKHRVVANDEDLYLWAKFIPALV